MYGVSDDRDYKKTGVSVGAFDEGSFLCGDRVWSQHCLYEERDYCTSESESFIHWNWGAARASGNYCTVCGGCLFIAVNIVIIKYWILYFCKIIEKRLDKYCK